MGRKRHGWIPPNLLCSCSRATHQPHDGTPVIFEGGKKRGADWTGYDADQDSGIHDLPSVALPVPFRPAKPLTDLKCSKRAKQGGLAGSSRGESHCLCDLATGFGVIWRIVTSSPM